MAKNIKQNKKLQADVCKKLKPNTIYWFNPSLSQLEQYFTTASTYSILIKKKKK